MQRNVTSSNVEPRFLLLHRCILKTCDSPGLHCVYTKGINSVSSLQTVRITIYKQNSNLSRKSTEYPRSQFTKGKYTDFHFLPRIDNKQLTAQE